MTTEPNVALCASIIELARVAAARLTVRDAALGFARLAAPQRTALQAQADRWDEVAGALLVDWRGLPAGAARQLAAMVPSDDELLLFALAAAPQIDRTLARAYRSLAGVAAFDVGVLLDLAGPSLEQRLGLVARLHADHALRTSGLVHLDSRGPAMLADVITVSPSAIAALRGEPIAPPGPAAAEGPRLSDELVPVVEAALMLPRWSPGGVTIVSGPPAERAAVLTLRSALDHRPVWHVVAPVGDAAAWCRDAALSEAFLGVSTDDPAEAIDALRHSARSTRAEVVISCDDDRLTADIDARTPRVSTRSFRRDTSPGLSQVVPPGPVRMALETLGF